MIIDELRQDIDFELTCYIKRFKSVVQIPEKRRIDIHLIREIIRKKDVVIMCKELNEYLDSVAYPFYTIFTFIEYNFFISTIKQVLKKEKYQDLNLMTTLIKEKDAIINGYESQDTFKSFQKTESNNFLLEIQLLKSENNYLYQTLTTLEKKIESLENEKLLLKNRTGKTEIDVKRGYFSKNNIVSPLSISWPIGDRFKEVSIKSS